MSIVGKSFYALDANRDLCLHLQVVSFLIFQVVKLEERCILRNPYRDVRLMKEKDLALVFLNLETKHFLKQHKSVWGGSKRGVARGFIMQVQFFHIKNELKNK